MPGGAPGLQIQWEAWLTRLRWVRFPHVPAKLVSIRLLNNQYSKHRCYFKVSYAFFVALLLGSGKGNALKGLSLGLGVISCGGGKLGVGGVAGKTVVAGVAAGGKCFFKEFFTEKSDVYLLLDL